MTNPTSLFNREAVTEVVLIARDDIDKGEMEAIHLAFPHAQIRRLSDHEMRQTTDVIFAGIRSSEQVLVVSQFFLTLIGFFKRGNLSFAFTALDENEFSVNRAEAGVVSRVYPDLIDD